MLRIVGMLILTLGAVGLAQADDDRGRSDGHWWNDGHSWNWDTRSHDGHGAVSAPEIDPASALSGLTLLVGGVVVARGRRRK